MENKIDIVCYWRKYKIRYFYCFWNMVGVKKKKKLVVNLVRGFVIIFIVLKLCLEIVEELVKLLLKVEVEVVVLL